jgi:hypothetical protein
MEPAMPQPATLPSNQIFTTPAAIPRRDVIAALALGVATPFVVQGAVAREPGIVPFRYRAVGTEQFFPHLVYWNEAKRGGHFAPLEVPELFVRELRNCFRSQRLS